jgi:hypothetical protein
MCISDDGRDTINRHQVSRFSNLARFTISIEFSLIERDPYFNSFVLALKEVCDDLPRSRSLRTVDSLNFTNNYSEEDVRLTGEQNATLKALPACILRINFLDDVIRAPPLTG